MFMCVTQVCVCVCVCVGVCVCAGGQEMEEITFPTLPSLLGWMGLAP